MPDISIQFHALPEELVPLIRRAVEDMRLHLTGVVFHPFSASYVEGGEIESAVINGPYRRFVFTEESLVFPIESAARLTQQAPGALYLEVGRETQLGLEESWLACRTGDSPINVKWKMIASMLRGITDAGVTAVSPATGAASTLKKHRFSAGAKRLYDKGVLIRPAAGNSFIKLGIMAAK